MAEPMEKPREVRLEEVVAECFKDQNFFEAIQDNPSEALKRRGLRLNEADLRELESGLADPDKGVKFRSMVEASFHLNPTGTNPTWKFIPVWWGPIRKSR